MESKESIFTGNFNVLISLDGITNTDNVKLTTNFDNIQQSLTTSEPVVCDLNFACVLSKSQLAAHTDLCISEKNYPTSVILVKRSI